MCKVAAYLGAAFVLAVGVLGPAIGQERIISACENLGKYPESANKIRAAMFLSIIIVESSAIYALLVAGFLILAGLWA